MSTSTAWLYLDPIRESGLLMVGRSQWDLLTLNHPVRELEGPFS